MVRVADGCEKRMAQNIKLESDPIASAPYMFKELKGMFKRDPEMAIDAFTAGYPVTKEQAQGALDGSIPVKIDATSVTLILS